MQSGRLQNALEDLKTSIWNVEAVVEEMHTEKDPLAIQIFVSRRNLRKQDTKSGKRRHPAALLSWRSACD
jgi:hypothetical protein